MQIPGREYIILNPVEAVTSVFRNFANFSGRAQRSEFWWFVLFAFISQSILSLVPFVGGIYSLVLLLPSLAVTARRLHDTDRTAWWMLFYLVPIVGFIILAIVTLSLLGINAFDPLQVNDVGWGVVGILFLVWLLGSIAAWIVLLVFQIMPGTVGPNRYGPDPLRPDVETRAPGFGVPGSAPVNAPQPAAGGYAAPGEPPKPEAPLAPDMDPDPEAIQRRFCTQCGMQLQPEARFCSVCGTSV